MTPAPQYYLITKDELTEVFSFLEDAPEFTQEIEGDVIARPYTSASSDVLEELIKWIDDHSETVIEGHIPLVWIDELKDAIEELRQQTKEQPTT